ncbi:hypothetical protein ACFLQJ_02735 [Calditrichota bacterium]
MNRKGQIMANENRNNEDKNSLTSVDPDYTELYKIFNNQETSKLQLQSQHANRYLSVVITLIIGSIASYSKLAELDLEILIYVALGLNVVICFLGIWTCTNLYRRALEAISMMIKLEGFIGLSVNWKEVNSESGNL